MFEYLEHTADLKVRVIAESLEALISEAVKATMNAIYEIEKVEKKKVVEYVSEGLDPGELMYDVVNYALALLDDGFAIADAQVKLEYSSKNHNEPGSWKAYVRFIGEKYSKEKHGFKTLIKAFTYNELKICLEGYDRVGEFVLDV